MIQLLDCLLDLSLVGLDINDEDQRVVVFDLLHGRLSGERVLNVDEFVRIAFLDSLADDNRAARLLQCLGLVEVHFGVDAGSLAATTGLQRNSSLLGLGSYGSRAGGER